MSVGRRLVFCVAMAVCLSGAVVAVGGVPVSETVDAVADAVAREYFDPEVGACTAEVLRRRGTEGRYSDADSLEALAQRLTSDLRDVTTDKHLTVAVSPVQPLRPPHEPVPDNAREVVARRSNHGVEALEILDGNVGYLNLTAFYRVEEVEDTLAAAMRVLREADALILDMRTNGGGSPSSVELLIGYLFEESGLPLFEVVPRSGESTQYATPSEPLEDRNGRRPVYVLTAKETFSAGEGLAFLLQERGRAEVVGETTAGAANPGRPYRVSDHFEVTIPNGQLRSAIGGGNWEGSGVSPDVSVPASDALRAAHARALRALLATTPSGPWRASLEEHRLALEGEAAIAE